MARSELILIGATTLDEHQKHIERDEALERRFRPVLVPEPIIEQTAMILRGLRDIFEAPHKVAITEKASTRSTSLELALTFRCGVPGAGVEAVWDAGSGAAASVWGFAAGW